MEARQPSSGSQHVSVGGGLKRNDRKKWMHLMWERSANTPKKVNTG